MISVKAKLQGVYSLIITKDSTDYFYIGSSEDLQSRISGHKSKLTRGVHHCKQLQRLYDEGLPLYVEIIELAQSIDDLISTESDYIDHFRRIEGIEVLNKRKPVVAAERIYLSVDLVKRIKRALKRGAKASAVADKLKVKPVQVYRIKCGERWRKIKV
jgi:hypothetical protein